MFINGRLATNTPNTNLQGIHSVLTSTVNMDTFAASNGLVKGGTYRVDLFYAHRGLSSTPTLQIQLPNATLCNALAPGFGQTAIAYASFASASSTLRLLGQAAISGTSLRLVLATIAGSSAGTLSFVSCLSRP